MRSEIWTEEGRAEDQDVKTETQTGTQMQEKKERGKYKGE